MKLPFSAVVVFCSSLTWAQTVPNPWFYQPLGQVQQYLQLTDAQLQTILANNGEYNQFATSKQTRISQLQSEIATETARETLDPMALGTRYVEIETICRELKDQANTYQQKNVATLTDQQRAKLQVLRDAMKLLPVISDAQSGNLIEASSYAPLFFTSTSAFTSTSGAVIGGMIGPVSGCSSPFRTALVRTGAFASPPTTGAVVPANRVSAATPLPGNRVPTHSFDTTWLAAPGKDSRE
ncbi:MAG: hypothetical protein ACM3ZB_16170 [bacterium]